MYRIVPIIPVIIEQHVENAAFNWLLRDRAVSEPHYDLTDLTHLDDRIEANIDGLRIAGDEGWEICREAMEIAEPGEIFTAAVRARALKAVGEMGRSDLLALTLDHLTDGDDKSRFNAAGSTAILGDASAVAALQTIAETESPYSERACTLAVRKMEPGDATIWL